MRLRLVFFIVLLLPVSCEERVDPKEAVIQQEVSKRVESVREDLKTEQDRRNTLRVVTLCLLAGGSLAGLFRLGENCGASHSASIPDPRRDTPSPGRRIINPSAEDHHRSSP